MYARTHTHTRSHMYKCLCTRAHTHTRTHAHTCEYGSVQNKEYTWVQFSSVTVISNKDSLLQSIYLYRRIMRAVPGIEWIDALELKKLASQPYTGAHTQPCTHHNMITTHDNKYTQKHTSECTSKHVGWHTGVKPRTLNGFKKQVRSLLYMRSTGQKARIDLNGLHISRDTWSRGGPHVWHRWSSSFNCHATPVACVCRG